MNSPLTLDQLEPVLATGRYQARTLPADAYLRDDVYEFERQKFFEASWVCGGRLDGLAENGTQKAVSVLGESLLLVRGADGVLRAFHNVCRHRGHQLLPEGQCTTHRAIVCPYHAWAYNLDGSLRVAPTMKEEEDFPRSEFPLQSVAVTEWFGWFFVNFSGDAPSLRDQLGNAFDLPVIWEPERMTVELSSQYEIAANWKLIIENYMECYHCPSIHPALCRVTYVDSVDFIEHSGAWLGGFMDLIEGVETMSLTGQSGGVRLRGLDDRRARQVLYMALMPNLLLTLHPDYVMTHRIDPIGPKQTAVECAWLFPPEAKELPGFDPAYAKDFWHLTNSEDLGACASVQLGLASKGYRRGPFAAAESEVLATQRMFARGYLDGRLSPEPAVAPA